MTSWAPKFSPYIILLLSACICSWIRWPILKKADRWICLLLSLTVIEESLAEYFKIYFRNNSVIYHIYTPIELFIICIYFDLSLKITKPYRLAFLIGIPGIIVSAFITIYIQPYYKFNSYFLLIEGLVIVSLCLLAFYKLLLREDIVPKMMAQFWLTISFLLYWSVTYISLGLFSGEVNNIDFVAKIIAWTLYIPNFLFYVSLMIVFIRYKKLIPSGE
ncbi:MAG: hypothetical protein ABI378_09735 [Chitinophagaceae bacterium]